jgi:hypothetical protein
MDAAARDAPSKGSVADAFAEIRALQASLAESDKRTAVQLADSCPTTATMG